MLISAPTNCFSSAVKSSPLAKATSPYPLLKHSTAPAYPEYKAPESGIDAGFPLLVEPSKCASIVFLYELISFVSLSSR